MLGDGKLDKLVNGFLEGIIEKPVYLEKKEELLRQKAGIIAKKEGFGQRGNNWNEPLRKWILEAHHAKKFAENGKLPDIRQFVEKIGTNRRLGDKIINWDWEKSQKILAERLQNSIWQSVLNKIRTFFRENPDADF